MPRTALAPAAEPDLDAVAAVADSLVRVTRAVGRARARLLAAAEHDVEWSAHVLLKLVQTEGPARAGALAEAMHADPSTISRQVASLVKDGLLERRADPQDGRASLLVLTEAAKDVLAEHNRVRLDYFARVLVDWTDEEVRDFAGLLDRFTTTYERSATEWTPPRLTERAARQRSTS
jgi:DNA-binding MarR family transcriptional regulator